MSGMSFSSGKQHVKPPQRGIFPLDHDAECKPAMEASTGTSPRWWFVHKATLKRELVTRHCNIQRHYSQVQMISLYTQKYLDCLKQERDLHYKCRELSKEYLQCRMDKQLMAQEDLNNVSFCCIVDWLFVLFLHRFRYRWAIHQMLKSRMQRSMTSRKNERVM